MDCPKKFEKHLKDLVSFIEEERTKSYNDGALVGRLNKHNEWIKRIKELVIKNSKDDLTSDFNRGWNCAFNFIIEKIAEEYHTPTLEKTTGTEERKAGGSVLKPGLNVLQEKSDLSMSQKGSHCIK